MQYSSVAIVNLKYLSQLKYTPHFGDLKQKNWGIWILLVIWLVFSLKLWIEWTVHLTNLTRQALNVWHWAHTFKFELALSYTILIKLSRLPLDWLLNKRGRIAVIVKSSLIIYVTWKIAGLSDARFWTSR